MEEVETRLLIGVELFASSGQRMAVWKKDEGDFLNDYK